MSDRNVDITKFSYSSYRKLKKTLGEFDAVVEYNEIAIKEFIANANTKYPNEYIRRLSDKHRVRVDTVDFFKFSSRIRQYYLASVSQQSEQFLQDFKNEWKSYFPNKNWLEKDKGETSLKNTLRNIKSMGSDSIDFNSQVGCAVRTRQKSCAWRTLPPWANPVNWAEVRSPTFTACWALLTLNPSYAL